MICTLSHPTWDYSSVDGLVAYDYATPGLKAFGFERKIKDRIPKEQRKEVRDEIIESINKGRPVRVSRANYRGVVHRIFNGIIKRG